MEKIDLICGFECRAIIWKIYEAFGVTPHRKIEGIETVVIKQYNDCLSVAISDLSSDYELEWRFGGRTTLTETPRIAVYGEGSKWKKISYPDGEIEEQVEGLDAKPLFGLDAIKDYLKIANKAEALAPLVDSLIAHEKISEAKRDEYWLASLAEITGIKFVDREWLINRWGPLTLRPPESQPA